MALFVNPLAVLNNQDGCAHHDCAVKLPITADDESLACEHCKLEFHIVCVEVSKTLYKNIKPQVVSTGTVLPVTTSSLAS